MRIDGVGTFVLTHKDGSVERFLKHNLIVTGGFDFICDVMGNAEQPTNMAFIGVGEGTDEAVASETSLQKELARSTAVYAHAEGTKTFTLTAEFPEGVATGAITEAGVFNADKGGIMLDRVTFAVINKGEDDRFTATFQFTLS